MNRLKVGSRRCDREYDVIGINISLVGNEAEVGYVFGTKKGQVPKYHSSRDFYLKNASVIIDEHGVKVVKKGD